MNSALYIYPWFDILTMINFPNIKTFIIIDCQPKFSGWKNMIDYSLEKDFKKHQEYYLQLIKNKYGNAGYHVILETNDKISFRNESTGQTIIYFHSIVFDEELEDKIIQKISCCNTLIIKDYFPEYFILDLLPKKFDLILSSKYSYNVENKKGCLFGDNNIKFEHLVNRWYLMDEKGDENIYKPVDVLVCRNRKEFEEIIEELKS